MKQTKEELSTIIDQEFVLDSFKIRIPIEKVEIIDSMIADYRIVHTGTGEMLEKAYKKSAYIHISNGIKFYFAIEQIKVTFKRSKEFLAILVTSKLLKEKYLTGITRETIRDIYKALIDCKVAKFTYSTFLKGEIVDIDFKLDTRAERFTNIVRACKEATNESIKNSGYVITFIKKDNQGIQFSKRETTNIDSFPFLKIYNKELDLLRNKDNQEFYKTYLIDQDSDIHRRIRIEYTIKNKKHLRRFDINDSSLDNILSLEPGKKVEMYLYAVSKYIDLNEPEPMRIRSNISPTNSIHILSMDYMTQQGKFTKESLLEYLISNIKNKSVRSRKRKELLSLFETHLSKRHQDTLKKVERKKKALAFLHSPYSR